ncbi:MAG: type 1 glutamine amidotransferase, partial [Gammaproteobacteria bacterium]|nr:type 1 glutamine amidotransferase [Gammaproteobacteria bacterium]
MTNHPNFLVIDGYRRDGREELQAGGATPAGELYSQMLMKCHPGCNVDIVYPADAGDSLPSGAALEAYDGLAWTGSSLTVYADDPAVAPQIALARAAFEAKVPSFGSCWAAQIGVVAAGGRCAANPRGREMGIARKITLTPEGRAHPLYIGKPGVFDAFISHEDECTHLPPGAVLLAGNAFTNVQAVAITYKGGTIWAVQYHPEYDLHEIARLTYCRIER